MRNLMLRNIDHELSESEAGILDLHLKECRHCFHEYGLLSVPRRVAQSMTPLEPSPYFYRTLKVRIENEAQSVAILQQFISLARRIIPSMAAVTLALLSVFAYLQVRTPQDDLHAAYERVILGGDLPLHRMVTEQRKITDASILSAIANQGEWQDSNYELK